MFAWFLFQRAKLVLFLEIAKHHILQNQTVKRHFQEKAWETLNNCLILHTLKLNHSRIMNKRFPTFIFVLCLCFSLAYGQGEQKSNLHLRAEKVESTDYSKARTLYIQAFEGYVKKGQMLNGVACGVKAASLYYQHGNQYREAFSLLRQIDQTISASKNKPSEEASMRYNTSKERMLMYMQLKKGESAKFRIERVGKNASEEIKSNPNSPEWEPVTTVFITNTVGEGHKPMVKVRGLDPNYIYQIIEEPWSWAYTQEAITVTRTDLLTTNPFKFKNTPKDDIDKLIRHAESKVTNDFSGNGSSNSVHSKEQ
jgi:hypothetical protein